MSTEQLPVTTSLTYSRQQAADLVGVSPQTLIKLEKAGDGPVRLRIGNRILYPRDSFLKWMADHREKTA